MHGKFNDIFNGEIPYCSCSGYTRSKITSCNQCVLSSVLGSCREGWTEFQASCYKEQRGPGGNWGRDWVEARAYCATEGAHVLSIESMQELFFIIRVSHNSKIHFAFPLKIIMQKFV